MANGGNRKHHTSGQFYQHSLSSQSQPQHLQHEHQYAEEGFELELHSVVSEPPPSLPPQRQQQQNNHRNISTDEYHGHHGGGYESDEAELYRPTTSPKLKHQQNHRTATTTMQHPQHHPNPGNIAATSSSSTAIDQFKCDKCGIQTFKVKKVLGVMTSRTVPINNQYVLHGRCLLCHPLPSSALNGTGQDIYNDPHSPKVGGGNARSLSPVPPTRGGGKTTTSAVTRKHVVKKEKDALNRMPSLSSVSHTSHTTGSTRSGYSQGSGGGGGGQRRTMGGSGRDRREPPVSPTIHESEIPRVVSAVDDGGSGGLAPLPLGGGGHHHNRLQLPPPSSRAVRSAHSVGSHNSRSGRSVGSGGGGGGDNQSVLSGGGSTVHSASSAPIPGPRASRHSPPRSRGTGGATRSPTRSSRHDTNGASSLAAAAAAPPPAVVLDDGAMARVSGAVRGGMSSSGRSVSSWLHSPTSVVANARKKKKGLGVGAAAAAAASGTSTTIEQTPGALSQAAPPATDEHYPHPDDLQEVTSDVSTLTKTNGYGTIQSLAPGTVKKSDVKALVKSMKSPLSKSDPLYLERTCHELWKISSMDGKYDSTIRDSGGIPAILSAMKSYPLHHPLQTKASYVLWSISMSSASNQNQVRKEGGIPLLAFAMEQHSGVAEVQSAVCLALTSLCNEGSNTANQNAVREARALPLIVDAIQKYASGDVGEHQAGSHVADSSSLSSRGGRSPDQQQQDEGVVKFASGALHAAIHNNQVNLLAARTAGAVGALTTARVFASSSRGADRNVVEKIELAISIFDESAHVILKSAAHSGVSTSSKDQREGPDIKGVLGVMRGHIACPTMVASCLRTLGSLVDPRVATNPKVLNRNRAALREHGHGRGTVFRAIATVMNRHSDSVKVQLGALYALAHLGASWLPSSSNGDAADGGGAGGAWSSSSLASSSQQQQTSSTGGPANRTPDMIECGVLPALVTAMKIHGLESPDVQSSCCDILAMAIRTTSPSQAVAEVQGEIVKEDAVPAIVRGMGQHYGGRPNVQRSGCDVLEALSRGNDGARDYIRSEGGIEAIFAVVDGYAAGRGGTADVAGTDDGHHPPMSSSATARSDSSGVAVGAGGTSAGDACTDAVLTSAFAALCTHEEEAAMLLTRGDARAVVYVMKSPWRDSIPMMETACVELCKLSSSTTPSPSSSSAHSSGGSTNSASDSRQQQQQQPQQQRGIMASVESTDQDVVSMCTLIHVMNSHMRSTSVVRRALSALITLSAKSPAHQTGACDGGAVQAVVATMERHTADARIQGGACCALANLSRNMSDVQSSVRDVGGILLVVRAMNEHLLDEDVQLYGSAALANLCWRNPRNMDCIRREGGIDAIVTALQHHGDNPRIRGPATGALGNLEKDAIRVISQHRDIKAIVWMMQSHLNSPTVQERACHALWTISSKHDQNDNMIRDAGGITAIIAAMKEHVGAPDVVEEAMGALWNLTASNAKNQDAIRKSGGIDAVCGAMDRHADDANIQGSGCCTLANLASSNPSNQRAARHAGAIMLVVSAMERHASFADVQHFGCGAIANLAWNDAENTKLLVESGSVAVVLTAMEQHPDQADVQGSACGALSNMCNNSGCRKIMRKNSGHRFLKLAAKRFPDQCGQAAEEVLYRVGKSTR